MRVCILGSGISALTLAKALVNENIYVDIISKNQNYKNSTSRTIGISKSNFNYFNKSIINIQKIAWEISKIEIYTDNLKNEKLLKFDNKGNQLFSILRNSKIYEILNKSLTHSKLCRRIKFKNKLLNFDEYNLVINTDYMNYLTKKFFSRKIAKSYNSIAYTTIIHHEKILNNVATQIFTKKGPLAFLPISKNKTSIVYSIQNLKKYSADEFNNLIFNYNSKYKINKIEKLESFELKSFVLRSYYHENILAFGDLLHRIHPLAGQGFNMTIRDIKILINIIKEKKNLGLSIDKSVIHQFEKKIKHKNYIFMNGIDLIYEFFNFERKLSNSILSKSVKLFGKNPSINKIFTNIADKGLII